jgi:D-alanyl-D-alanine dipeptidase
MNAARLFAIVIVLILQGWPLPGIAKGESDSLPVGFVYLADIAPEIQCDLAYAGDNNFIGSSIDGYLRNVCIMTESTARALKQVALKLKLFGLRLKVFDAYRPQRAVDHFVRWAGDVEDTPNKPAYYPNIKKENLIKEGYIAGKSGHSRGSTVDLTILAGDRELDMGTSFDFFGRESWLSYDDLSPQQRANRLLLKTLMEQYGFRSYAKEWWHFTLDNEPFPDTYFDFPVQ